MHLLSYFSKGSQGVKYKMDTMKTRDFLAYLDDMQWITILVPHTLAQNFVSSFLLECGQKEIPMTIEEEIHLPEFIKFVCYVSESLKIGCQYWVKNGEDRKTDLQIGAVTRTKKFDELYYYDGKLGVQYGSNKTFFRLWAPTATMVKLQLFSPDRSQQKELDMIRGEKGLWTLEVKEELENYHYMYSVCVNNEWREAVDPYAIAVTANGEEGVIVDLNKTKIQKKELPPLENKVDSIIYETHIRDFSIHESSGVSHKGKYNGAAEIDTADSDENPTCLTYVKNLGITHIELLPIHDFFGVDELGDMTEYNWGYNPLHFNVPDGSYSLNPEDPYERIHECKKLISTFHQHGIRVILDVVYNHVFVKETSSFEKIVPGYFFRYDEHGMPSNGTGVGNDIASERKMVRKFIIDSVLYWLEEYHIDGFRFDLMGILDTDTMNKIREAVDRIDPQVLLIGEGWDLNTPLPHDKKAMIHNQDELPRIGQFNDWFRDSIKGSTFNLYDLGYALGNEYYYEMARQTIAGSIGLENAGKGIFTEPEQSVNYVESHDNHTLWDKLLVCMADEEKETIQKYHCLATSIVLLSQGIPFLHSGQEFFRTKKGIGNSYRSPNEINELDWNRKNKYSENVNYIKGLISIRKYYKAFRLPSAELIRKHMKYLPLKKPLLGWTIENMKQKETEYTILVLINPTKVEESIELPKGKWHVLADENVSGVNPIKKIFDQKLAVKPISSYVLIHFHR